MRCFSSPGSLPVPMDSARDDPIRAGFPHSEICGSMGARASPQLFAACHVLHRLSVPRHPPNALLALDRFNPSRTDAKTGKLTRPLGKETGTGIHTPCATLYFSRIQRRCSHGSTHPDTKPGTLLKAPDLRPKRHARLKDSQPIHSVKKHRRLITPARNRQANKPAARG